MELADRVRLRREELGLSQEDLAMRMGYSSRTSINKIENGRPCSQKIIARLAKALNVSIPYLMGWEEEEKPTGETTDEPFTNLSEEARKFLVVFEKLTPDQKEQLYRLALTIVGEVPQPL